MAEASILAQSRDRRSLADLIAWMNAQPRKPGEEPVTYHHRQVRAFLEELRVPLYQGGPRAKVWFYVSDLMEQSPKLAKAFLGTGTTADARAE